MLATDQRIDAPLARQLVEVAGVGIQRIAGSRGLSALFVLHLLLAFVLIGMTGHLGDAVGNVVDHVDAGHALLLEQKHGLALLLTEDGDQHVGARHLTLARALHMEYGALKNALEAQGRLGLAILVMLRDQRRGGVDELLQIMPELIQVGATGAQYGRCSLVIQQSQKQMLDRHELMALGTCLLEGQIEGDFQLSIQHSFTSCPSGTASAVLLYLTE